MNGKSRHTRGMLRMTCAGCLVLALFSGVLIAAGEPDLMSETAKAAARARGAKVKVNATVRTPDIIAVRIRHDMCPFCKGFDSKFPKLIRDAGKDAVLFVTLDMTTETTQEQAALLLAALSLEHLWTGDLSQMGSILFVDGTSKQVVSTAYQVDAKTVELALRAAIASARGKG